MHSGRVHSLNPYTFIEIHRNLKKSMEIYRNTYEFQGFRVCVQGLSQIP